MLKTLLTVIFKNTFFVMSISGTVVFICYMILYPLSKRYVSLKWRYRILKIAMICFLVPFPLCKYHVWGFFYDHFSSIREIASQYTPEMNMDYIIVVNRDSTLLSPKVQSIYLAVSVIVLISSLMVWRQITQYRKMKQMCFDDLGEPAEQKLQEIFYEKKAILNIKRKVRLICSEYCKSPITNGILSPTILFPRWDKDDGIDDELYEYMVTHELVHIKHNDVLIKLMALFVIAVHWFNPFVYLLISELSCISEMYCDSVVMDGKGKEERSKYGNLLLKLAVEDVSFDKERFGMGFANFRKKRRYKRRILELKENKSYQAFLSVIMAAFISMAGGITVFAYRPPHTITNGSNEKTVTTDFGVMEKDAWPEQLVSDYFAVADDGTVYDLCHMDENDRLTCPHNNFVQVEITEHIRKSNGDCTMNVYDGLICTKCYDIKDKELLYTCTWVPCPH